MPRERITSIYSERSNIDSFWNTPRNPIDDFEGLWYDSTLPWVSSFYPWQSE